MPHAEVVVVGAGPGGLAAATEAARASAAVQVLDEYPQPGGQYHRQPWPGLAAAPDAPIFQQAREGRDLAEAARQAGVRFLPGALVWGAFPDGSLAIHDRGRCEVLRPAALILAPGAIDRPVAFPGWTLPGVMTAGAAQALLKGQGVLPGRRILMAGTGPLQIAVAAQLVEAGAHVAGVLEAGRLGRLFGSGPRFWGQWGRLREGLQYWRTLRSAKVPITFGRTVIRAEGNPVLARVVTAELDGSWRPIAGTESAFDADALCLGFGLVPNTKLARLLGCELAHDPARGGLVPVRDESMQTSRAGVFVAGEAAGIAGARAAELQGRIAGIAAARQIGKGDPGEAAERLKAMGQELERELRFARSLNETFAPQPGILDLITDDTVICRCEEVTAGRLRADLSGWVRSLDVVRTVSRAGMGLCQGSTCETLVAQLLAHHTGQRLSEVGAYHLRPPVKPISVGALADLADRLPPPPARMDH